MATDLRPGAPKAALAAAPVLAAALALGPGTALAQQAGDQAPRPAIVLPGVQPQQPVQQQPPETAPADPVQRRRNIDLEFGVTLGATYSDNVLLRPEGADSKGTLIEVTPFVAGRFDNGRSRARLRASVTGRQARAEDERETETAADVRADVDAQVSGDFRVAADGVFTRAAKDEFLAGAVTPNQELVERTNIGVSPYLAGRVGRDHFYEVRYALRGIDPGQDDPSNVIQRFGMELRSDPNWASDFGWGVFTDASSTRYENDVDYFNASADLVAFYRVSDTLRFGAGVNATSIDILPDEDGETTGLGPTLYMNYALSNRRNLGLRWADTYYGEEVAATGWMRTRRWIGGFEYRKGIEDGNAADALVLNTQDFLRPQNRVARSLAGENAEGPPWARIEDISVLVATGGLDTPLVNQEKTVLAGGYEGLRNTAVLAVFRNRLAAAVPDFGGFAGGRSDAIGTKLILGHKINLRNSVAFTAEYRDIDSPDPDETGVATIYSLSYSNKVTRSLTTTIALRTYKKSDTHGQPDIH